MADPIPTPERSAPPPTPRWVKVFGIILVVVVLLVGIALLAGGEHGPGRHMPRVEHTTQQP
jgi:hypothetical protein